MVTFTDFLNCLDELKPLTDIVINGLVALGTLALATVAFCQIRNQGKTDIDFSAIYLKPPEPAEPGPGSRVQIQIVNKSEREPVLKHLGWRAKNSKVAILPTLFSRNGLGPIILPQKLTTDDLFEALITLNEFATQIAALHPQTDKNELHTSIKRAKFHLATTHGQIIEASPTAELSTALTDRIQLSRQPI